MSEQSYIPATSLDYLKTLKENNNRDWFNENKEAFIKQQLLIENFAELLLKELNDHDVIETPSGKRACTASIKTLVFLKTKLHTKPIGAVAIQEPLHNAGEAIIFISNQVTVLWQEVFGHQIRKT